MAVCCGWDRWQHDVWVAASRNENVSARNVLRSLIWAYYFINFENTFKLLQCAPSLKVQTNLYHTNHQTWWPTDLLFMLLRFRRLTSQHYLHLESEFLIFRHRFLTLKVFVIAATHAFDLKYPSDRNTNLMFVTSRTAPRTAPQ